MLPRYWNTWTSSTSKASKYRRYCLWYSKVWCLLLAIPYLLLFIPFKSWIFLSSNVQMLAPPHCPVIPAVLACIRFHWISFFSPDSAFFWTIGLKNKGDKMCHYLGSFLSPVVKKSTDFLPLSVLLQLIFLYIAWIKLITFLGMYHLHKVTHIFFRLNEIIRVN